MRGSAWLAVLLAVFFVGCGAQAPAERVEEAAEKSKAEEAPAPPEPTAEEAASPEPSSNEQSPPSQADAEDANAAYARQVITAYKNGGNATQVECQLAKLQLDVGPEEAQKVVDDFTNGLVADIEREGAVPEEGPTLPEYLAEKGYTC